ncbi:hypothetical protein [Candidatus Profftia tarda]|nr:hypothetical protein [Candidatus Profftia tarda]
MAKQKGLVLMQYSLSHNDFGNVSNILTYLYGGGKEKIYMHNISNIFSF